MISLPKTGLNFPIHQTHTFADVAKAHLKHFMPDTKIPGSPQGNPDKFRKRQKILLLEPSERATRTAAFNVLIEAEKECTSPPVQTIINQTIWKDLDLLCGSDEHPEKYLGSVINRTYSQIGKAYLLGLISRPSPDIPTLKKRQSVIRDLSGEYRAVAVCLTDQLQGIKEDERQLLSFWDDKTQLSGSVNSHYFKFFSKHFSFLNTVNKVLNNNAIALELNALFHNFDKTANTASNPAKALLLPLFALSLTGLCTPSFTPFLKDFSDRFVGTSGALNAFLSLVPNLSVKGFNAIRVGISSALVAQSVFLWNKADLGVEADVQEKLMKVAHFYRKMKTIHGIVSNQPTLRGNLEHFALLDSFINNKELKPLFQTLESRTFDDKSNYFFRRGNVLLAWNQLSNPAVRKQFQPALMAMAEIDALVSSAWLVKEGQTNHSPYCFPNYLSNTPVTLKLTDFSSPLIKRPIRNSISLGGRARKANAVVTGPNAAGKSSVLKGMAACVILAQSLGIAPCKKMELTPFSFIASSMNISDDINSKKSGLQAQVKVISDLIKTRKEMLPGRFSLMILDEMFNQTTAKEGSALGVATVNNLVKEVDNIALIVTHDAAIQKIQEESKRVTNYKLSTEARTNNPLYRLEVGTSIQNIALDVASQAGLDESIIRDAQQILNQRQ